jgi:hypothetical protein
MLVRSILTLLIFTSSTVAAAREPAPLRTGYSGGLAPTLLAARAADPMIQPPPDYDDPDYGSDPTAPDPTTATDPITGEPLTTSPTETTAPMITTSPPQNIRPPKMPVDEWEREKRKLQAKTAVTWVLTGVGIAGVAVPLAMLRACDEADRTRVMDCSQERTTAAIAAPIFGALTLASVIPAIVYSTRLARHNRYYSGLARVGVSPGGLVLRF